MTSPWVVAHLVTTGLGPIYDGISHLLVSPDDLLPVLAIGVLAGLNGAAAGRRALFTLPAAWVLGGTVGYAVGGPALPDGVAACSSLVVGVLVAASPRLSPGLLTGLACLIGLLHGWLNGAAIAGAQREILGLAGIALTTFVLIALAAALAVSLRSATARLVLRVAGSWIAAIGLLMLGWSLRGA
jgi:hydrogenase/urease accessory protein HupE